MRQANLKLGVSGWRVLGQRTGVGRYLLNVVANWTPDVVAGKFGEINFYTPAAIDRSDVPLPDNICSRVLPPHWRMLVWENFRLAPVARDDVLFCPSYTRPLYTHGRTVVTTFEANLHWFPQMFSLSGRIFYDRLYGWSARHATLVLTTTETARQDVARAYGVPPERIRAVPLAPAAKFKSLADDPRVAEVGARYFGSAGPFFLFVGKLTPRRNVPLLIEAFARFKQQTGLPHRLLIVGLNSMHLDVDSLAARLGVGGSFKYAEYVPDDELILLYNAAAAFVMPSTYEAVSLTTLEAQATGTPVITLDLPGLREMTGGIAQFLAKPDAGELAAALAGLAGDPALCRDLAARGLAHAQKFSWRRTSEQTLAVLAEAIQDDPANLTRFVVLALHDEAQPSGDDKTSILFAVRDEVGILVRMLRPFAVHGIDLIKIESRPLRGRPWEYVFFLDLKGHRRERRVRQALADVEKSALRLKVLGSYPAATAAAGG